MLDLSNVDKRTNIPTEIPRSILGTIAAAVMGLARRAGSSLHHHPMPELREVSREWRRSRAGV
jgi:predicted regulator of Ras-like GTPase activity (Roadblock/LC7/MglB family)